MHWQRWLADQGSRVTWQCVKTGQMTSFGLGLLGGGGRFWEFYLETSWMRALEGVRLELPFPLPLFLVGKRKLSNGSKIIQLVPVEGDTWTLISCLIFKRSFVFHYFHEVCSLRMFLSLPKTEKKLIFVRVFVCSKCMYVFCRITLLG